MKNIPEDTIDYKKYYKFDLKNISGFLDLMDSKLLLPDFQHRFNEYLILVEEKFEAGYVKKDIFKPAYSSSSIQIHDEFKIVKIKDISDSDQVTVTFPTNSRFELTDKFKIATAKSGDEGKDFFLLYRKSVVDEIIDSHNPKKVMNRLFFDERRKEFFLGIKFHSKFPYGVVANYVLSGRYDGFDVAERLPLSDDFGLRLVEDAYAVQKLFGGIVDVMVNVHNIISKNGISEKRNIKFDTFRLYQEVDEEIPWGGRGEVDEAVILDISKKIILSKIKKIDEILARNRGINVVRKIGFDIFFEDFIRNVRG